MPETNPVALVTGGSAGLGKVIAESLVAHGYLVILVGRDEERLSRSKDELQRALADSMHHRVHSRVCDVTNRSAVAEMFRDVGKTVGRLDVLVNCVGQSDRGLIERLEPERLERLFHQNVISALLCSQQAIELLTKSRGTIVNIGSLASKVGPRYVGGYAIAKHGLAGLTQQLRLELKSRGIHVGLISPGPIQRSDAGQRYDISGNPSLPSQAAKPGAGTRVSGIPPQRVAKAVIRCVQRRVPDIILPGYLRILVSIGHLFPRIGDWLLLKFTSSKSDPDSA